MIFSDVRFSLLMFDKHLGLCSQKFFSLIFLCLIASGFSGKLYGQGSSIYKSALTYSLTALNTSYDARASALGGTSVATMADASSPYLNLAKLPFHTRKFGGSLSYSPVLFDLVGLGIHAGVFQGFYNFGKNNNNSISGGFQMVSYGNTDARTNGVKVATYNPSQISGFLGFARRFGRISVGASFQFVSQSLIPSNLQLGGVTTNSNTSSVNFGGNLGVYYSNGERESLMEEDVNKLIFNLGLSVKNIGPKIQYLSVSTFQPANISLGGAIIHTAGENFILQESLEIRKLLIPIFPDVDNVSSQDIETYFNQSLFESYGAAMGQFQTTSILLGLEAYIVPARLFVRLGGTYGNYLFGNDGGITITGGLGYKYLDYGIHFAYNYTPWSLSKSSIFLTLFWDTGGFLEEDDTETFDLDFFSVQDLFPELE